MFFFTRMGWLVPVIWIAALAFASQIPPDRIAALGVILSRPAFVFLTAAALSTPLVFLAGLILNREKTARTIKPFGRQRTVYWGTHTFYMMPIGYWAIMIPAATLFAYVVFALI